MSIQILFNTVVDSTTMMIVKKAAFGGLFKALSKC